MKATIIFLFLLSGLGAGAQDHIYSQSMAAPTYLNPAFTGTSANCFRTGVIFRRQWMRVPSGMQYGTAFFDKYAERAELGLGAMATYSQEGYLRRGNLSLLMSKEILQSSAMPISFGAQLEAGSVGVNWDKLYFPTQVNDQGLVSIPSGVDRIRGSRYYFDVSAGSVVNLESWMIGVAVHNLIQHDESVTGTLEARLPRRFTLHVSHLRHLGFHDDDDEPGQRLIFNAAVFSQARNLTAMAGAEVKWEKFNIGLAYRANISPVRSDAIMLTLAWENFMGSGRHGENRTRYAVNYEPTLTGFGYYNTFGSGELSISHGGGGDCEPGRRYSSRTNWRNGLKSVSCPYKFW